MLPVTLRYSVPNGFNLSWALPLGTGAHFWKTMCAWGKHVDVEILPLHRPSAAELADGASISQSMHIRCFLTLHRAAMQRTSLRRVSVTRWLRRCTGPQ